MRSTEGIKEIKNELEKNNLYDFSERPEFRNKHTKYDEILNTIVPDTIHWEHWIKSESREKKIELAKKILVQQCIWEWDWDELERTKRALIGSRAIQSEQKSRIEEILKDHNDLFQSNKNLKFKYHTMVSTYEIMESLIKEYGLFDIYKTKVLLKEIKETK